MKQKLLNSIRLRIALLVALLCSLGTGSVWATDPVTLASWTFTSESYPSNKTNFSATGGSCTGSTFYLNGSGSTWNVNKGYAFTAVTDIVITLKTTVALPAGTTISFSADTYYNKASNAPMTGFTLTASENGGSYVTTGLDVTSFSLSTSSATKTCVYTLQNNLAVNGTVAIKYTQTGKAGSGQGYFGNINVTYTPASIAITSIAFDKSEASIGEGGTVTITPTISPFGYTETPVWESTNTSVATVSNGIVTGVSEGEATIRLKSPTDATIKAECAVTVTAPVAVTGVSLNKNTTTLLLGGTETLSATVAPADATNKNVTWTSADATKVSVENGVITALALTNGTPVNITVTTEDGSKTATCAVTVNPVPVSSVTLDKTEATLRIGKTLTLTETVNPDNATDKTVTWESDDEEIATVEDGVVTAVAVGTATITVKSNADNTKSATCEITVTDGAIELAPGDVITFDDFSGAGTGGYKTQNCDLEASDGNLYEWSEVNAYSNGGWQLKASTGDVTSPAIKTTYGFIITATMSANSVVISDGTNEGTNTLTTSKTNTTITISSTSSYAKISSITITALKQPVATDLAITDPGTLATGATGTFAYTKTTEESNTKAWTSDNTSAITITNASTGAYSATGRGTAKITLTLTPTDATNYKSVSAERTVSVTAPVVITASDVSMTYGEAAKAIGATTSTGYAGTLSYSSGNTYIATVDASGKVTAVAAGSTTITISAPADAGNLYTAGEDKVINVTVSAPAGGTDAATAAQTADDYETLKSAATGWTYTEWTTHSTYGACSTAGTAGTLKTKDYTIPEKANPCVFFEHTGKTFADPSVACKLYVQEGDNTPVELTIPTYFKGDKYDDPYIESGDIDITAYRGKTVHFIFDYTPSTDNAGKWEVKNFGIYYDIFSVKLNGSGYATYCSEYPLDFSDYATADYSAWQIKGISGKTITFEQIKGSVKGGTGLFLKGAPNAIISLTSADSDNELDDNLLIGTTAPTYVAVGTAYGLKDDKFVINNAAGNIKANRAYLSEDDVPDPSSVKSFTFVFEDTTTGITETRTATREEVEAIFNLNGQRMSKMQRGINIVNGRKVLVK